MRYARCEVTSPTTSHAARSSSHSPDVTSGLRLEGQSQSGQVSKPHDRGFTANRFECLDVAVVANSTSRDDRDTTRAGHAVEVEVRTSHRAVSIDRRDV